MSFDQASKQIDRQKNREYPEIPSELDFLVFWTETKWKKTLHIKHPVLVTWKRLNTETPQHGNASKKQNHKTNLMPSSNIKNNLTIIIPLI